MEIKLLTVSSISKFFPLKRNFLQHLFRLIIGYQPNSCSSFTALDDVSFTVNRGESVGILGLNGSGKSTLLQIIAGTMIPSSGKIEIEGKIASILELGSGFNQDFTGIENIYLNASLYGFSTKETEKILPEIANFSDIGDYINQPVRTYSSGMVVRLAYGILANVHPELLLVDEALAVGDFLFQQKCINSMRKLQQSGTGILFVSHSLDLISEFCEKVLILDNGKQYFYGNLKEGIFLYEKKLLEEKENMSQDLTSRNSQKKSLPGSKSNINSLVELIEFDICDNKGNLVCLIQSGNFLIFKFTILFKKKFADPHCGFKIVDDSGKVCFGINTYSLKYFCGEVLPSEKTTFEFKLNQKLQPGKYSVNVGIADGGYGYKSVNFKNSLGFIQTNTVFEIVSNENCSSWTGPVLIETNVISY